MSDPMLEPGDRIVVVGESFRLEDAVKTIRSLAAQAGATVMATAALIATGVPHGEDECGEQVLFLVDWRGGPSPYELRDADRPAVAGRRPSRIGTMLGRLAKSARRPAARA